MGRKYIFFLLFSTLLYGGETKTEKISSDFTVQKSERKAVILNGQLGMRSYSYKLPVKYCPDSRGKKKPKCVDAGTWKGSLSKSEVNSIFGGVSEQLVSKRYDILDITGSRATISTATAEKSVKLRRGYSFRFSTGDEDKFNRRVKGFLTEIEKPIQKILSGSREARYEEMSGKDQSTFIREKGKDSGLPAVVVEKLMNSGYYFSLYYGKIEGSITINQVMTEKKTYYTTTLNIPRNLILKVYQLKDGEFIEYSTISVEGGNSRSEEDGLLKKFMGGASGSSSNSISTDRRPSSSDSKRLVREGFSNTLKEAVINLNTQLKEDRNFKIIAPIKSVDGNSLWIEVGIQEDIRVDHPFMVERTVDGELKTVGFFKVRKSGKNCLSKPQNQREESEATAIKGNLEAYDLALEHPWTGVFTTLSVGSDSTYFSTINDIELQGGNSKFLSVGTKADLGYILNSSPLSEVWLGLSLSVGTQDDIDSKWFRDVSSISGTANFGIYLDVAKRLYIGNTGVYTDFGLDLGYRAYAYDYEDGTSTYNYETDTTSDGKNLTLAYMEASPFAKVGWNWSPDVEFFGKVGYTVPFGTTYTLKDGDDNEYQISAFDTELTANGGLNFLFGLSVHTNFTGGFTKLFSKPPSKACKTSK